MKPKRWEVLVVLVLVLSLGLWAFWPKHAGNRVAVTVDGREAGTYALDRDQSLPVEGYGGFRLSLVISGGQAHVEDSTCPDLICQHHSAISRAGEQIICLPGRVVITVTGEEDQVDAVTQ